MPYEGTQVMSVDKSPREIRLSREDCVLLINEVGFQVQYVGTSPPLHCGRGHLQSGFARIKPLKQIRHDLIRE